MQDIDDRIAENQPKVTKTTPDVWVIVGMIAQWVVERLGSSYDINYDTMISIVDTLSSTIQNTSGGSMTIAAAIAWFIGKFGYKYWKQ